MIDSAVIPLDAKTSACRGYGYENVGRVYFISPSLYAMQTSMNHQSNHSLARFVSKTILQGLAIVLPVIAAGYLLIWVARDSERAIRSLLLLWLPQSWYIPGLGIALFAALTFLLGLMMYPFLTRTIFNSADRVFRRIPLFGNVYGPIRDLFDLLGGDMADQLGEVVMIKVPGTEMETLGFITRRTNAGLPEGTIPEGHVVVYVQWSSQIGGYCFIVPEDSIRPVHFTTEEGMRWALTGGISGPRVNV